MSRLLRMSLEAIEERVEARDQEEGEGGRHGKPTDDGSRERKVRLASLANPERHRDEAGNRRDGGHQDGTQSCPGREDRRLDQLRPAPTKDVGEVDEENSV